jgi:hypothetical protein
MPEPSKRLSAAGYTRESVDDYVGAAAAEQREIERAIAAARARTDLAERRAKWLDELTPPSPQTEDTAPFGTAAVEPSSPTGWGGVEPETSRALAGSPSLFAYE